MHTYRVFECIEGDPNPRDTGKTIQVKPTFVWDDYYAMLFVSNSNAIVSAVFALYGFTLYPTYYKVRQQSTVDLIRICYNYGEMVEKAGEDGFNDTWILKRGV